MNIKEKLPKSLIIVVSSIITLVLYKQVHLIVAPLHLQRILASFLMHLIVCLPIGIVLLILYKPKYFFYQLGLHGNFLKGMVFALISTLPLFIAFPIVGKYNNELTLERMIRSTVIVAVFGVSPTFCTKVTLR